LLNSLDCKLLSMLSLELYVSEVKLCLLSFQCNAICLYLSEISVSAFKLLQAYHRDLLEQRAQEATVRIHSHPPPALVRDRSAVAVKSSARKSPRRGRGDRKSGSRRHRKIGAGRRNNTMNTSI